MGVLTLQWDNSDVLASPIGTGQRASKRIKTVGGAFDTSGFTPANDLATSATSVQVTLTENKVYQFKIDGLCSIGGPTPNNNGLIEGIVFGCIIPDITKTTTTAQVVVDVSNTDITKLRFVLRLTADDSVVATVSATRVANSVTGNFSSLVGNTNYYVTYEPFAIIDGVEKGSTDLIPSVDLCGDEGEYPFTTNNVPNFVWRPLDSECEKAGLFSIVKTITGLKSPAQAWFDPILNRVWVGDLDDPLGNVYWFDPATAVSPSDMNHVTAVMQDNLYNCYMDGPNRRIYFVGANTGGLIVYFIDTNTASLVPFGTNGPFRRVVLTVAGNNILCNDGNDNLVVIDRTTLTVSAVTAFTSLPTSNHFTSGPFILMPVGASEIWVCSNNNGLIGTVGVYSLDLATHFTEITLPGAAVWSGGFNHYWQSIVYDATSNTVLAADAGSSRRYVIDAATKTVLDTQTATDKEGKLTALYTWTLNLLTNELLCLYQGLNSSSDPSPKKRVYKQDRATYAFTDMIINQYFNNLNSIGGTSQLVGMDTGPTISGGLDTDGTITVLSNTTGTDNTGREIINTLEEVDANNGDAPTGNTKPNMIGDPDYEPPIDPSADCPVTVSLDCSTNKVKTFAAGVLQFEFAIKDNVRLNPAIATIRVSAFNTDTSAVNGTPLTFTSPFASNYFSGSFSSLPGTNYVVQVEYLDISNAVLATCT